MPLKQLVLKPRNLAILAIVVVAIVIFAVVFLVFFPSGPDTVTQNCPPSECPLGAPPPIHFAVAVNMQGCQPWFQATQPQINSLTAYDTTATPSASIGHGLDLFGTTMNIWVNYQITYGSGKTYTWTSTQYAVTAGNGACSPGVNIIGYFTGEPGTYTISATGYSQAINCWPGACSIQSTTAGPKIVSL